jgi:hypothetical protein
MFHRLGAWQADAYPDARSPTASATSFLQSLAPSRRRCAADQPPSSPMPDAAGISAKG